MLRMLVVSYCYGIRFERKPCEDVELHLAYRRFCRLDLGDKVPDHSTFSINRYGRFRDSDIFRHLFEAVVGAEASRDLLPRSSRTRTETATSAGQPSPPRRIQSQVFRTCFRASYLA